LEQETSRVFLRQLKLNKEREETFEFIKSSLEYQY
jgi:hypothetical protein